MTYTRKSTTSSSINKNSSRGKYVRWLILIVQYTQSINEGNALNTNSNNQSSSVSDPFQRANSITGRNQQNNLNNSQILNQLKASNLSSRNNIQRSTVSGGGIGGSSLNQFQSLTNGQQTQQLPGTSAAQSFLRQSRNTDPLLSPLADQSLKKQYSTQDGGKRPSQLGGGPQQQTADHHNISKDYSKNGSGIGLPPHNNIHQRKDSKSRQSANNQQDNKPSSRLSYNRGSTKIDGDIKNSSILERSRNYQQSGEKGISSLYSSNNERKPDFRMQNINDLNASPAFNNQVLTPQNQTQPLVSSTGGSYDHKLQLRQNSENRQIQDIRQKNQQFFGQQQEPQLTKPVMIVNPLKNFDEAKFSSKSHGLIVSYAANTHQGIQRNYNEDRVSIILNMTRPASKKNLPAWPKCSFFAIYDGHGGSQCADFLKEYLHQIIINQDCFPANPAQALTNGCLAAEAQFIQIADQQGRHDKSGSCAIIVLIVESNCYVANVGDSRAIMSAEAGQKLFVLSRDHRPNEDQEKLRITENGGKIYQTQTFQTISPQNSNNPTLFGSQQLLIGPFRVLPGRLSVSRTFGDIEAKLEKFGGKPGVVIAQPEIAQFAIQEDLHDFIILGCDGIFDRLNNLQLQDCAWKTIEQHKNSPQSLTIHQVCGKVVDQVLQLSAIEKSFDNLTLVMIAFKNMESFFNKKDSNELTNTKNIKILEEESHMNFMPPTSSLAGSNLTPQQKSNNKKMLLEKLIQSKRGVADQKLSSRGRSHNPFDNANESSSKSPKRQESNVNDSSGLPSLKQNGLGQSRINGLQNQLSTIQSRKSTRNKFLSNTSNTNYLAQQQQMLDIQNQTSDQLLKQNSIQNTQPSQPNNTTATAQIINSRNRALASFYNSEKINFQANSQQQQTNELQNLYRKSRQGLTQVQNQANTNHNQILNGLRGSQIDTSNQGRPKSNSRITNSNLVIDSKKSISNYNSNPATTQQNASNTFEKSQLNSANTPQKYGGSFQFPMKSSITSSTTHQGQSPQGLFSSNFTPKQNQANTQSIRTGSIINPNGSVIGMSSIIKANEDLSRQSINFDKSSFLKNSGPIIPSPDKKKNLPTLKGPRAQIDESSSFKQNRLMRKQ